MQLITNLCTFTKQSQTQTTMNATTTTTSKKMSDNTKANIIAFGIMGVIIAIGILYGMQLEKIAF